MNLLLLVHRFFYHLYFSRDRVDGVFSEAVVFLAAAVVGEFEYGDSRDSQTGNASQNKYDEVDPVGILTVCQSRELLLESDEGNQGTTK